MKRAVIAVAGKQYLVNVGETIEVDLIQDEKTVAFEPLLTIDGDKISVGAPSVTGVKVNAEIVQPEIKGDKVLALRYKAKKRVHTVRGHRQRHTQIKITKIS